MCEIGYHFFEYNPDSVYICRYSNFSGLPGYFALLFFADVFFDGTEYPFCRSGLCLIVIRPFDIDRILVELNAKV